MTLSRRPLPRYLASLRWARRAALASALLLGAAGCGSSGHAGSSTGGAGGVGGGAGTGGSAGSGGVSGSGGAAGSGGAGGSTACTPAPSYPVGPYGENIGDTIPDWHWKGYVNEDSQGLSNQPAYYVNDYSMDDLRKSGRGYALVHLSEDF